MFLKFDGWWSEFTKEVVEKKDNDDERVVFHELKLMWILCWIEQKQQKNVIE